jgi:glycosyltransferase involved in cell wall biosynthesis
MHITLLLTQDLESPGGLGRCWPIAKELARAGHTITVLALHSDYFSQEPDQLEFTREGVHVKYVAQMHVRKVGSYKYYFKPLRMLWVALVAMVKLTHAALSTSADVYHICKPHPMNGLAGLLASRLRRKPLFVDYDDVEVTINRFDGSWQRSIVSFFEQALPLLADGTTTHTEYTFQRLVDAGVPSDEIVYVPNGVDRARFSRINEERLEEMGQQLGLAGKRVILYLGSMSLTTHPVDLLLRAFSVVRETLSHAVLLIVGGGEDYDEVRLLADTLGISDGTKFVGRVDPDQVPYYYRLAEVSVDPIYDDITARARFPLKLVESLAMRTPIVTGSVGDRVTVLEDAGVLVKPGNAESLARGILTVLGNPQTALQMERAAERICQEYFWDVLVSDFLKVYEL